MLSILIPVYNYSIFTLVETLHREASLLNIPFEILVQDDASTKYIEENKLTGNLSNVTYQANKVNIGRTATRDALAKRATNNTLLFLDADVLPVKENFLKIFLDHKNDADLIIGGTAYQNTLPSKEYSLRWEFGRNREVKTVVQRNTAPYLSVISQCLFIKKETFLLANKNTTNAYGMDIYFSHQLKNNAINIKHIDNPVYHLGLETNEVFMVKSLGALDTLITLENQNMIVHDYSNIQRAYLRLRKYKMNRLASYILNNLTSYFEQNLKSNKPSLLYFDLYRLSYYIKRKHA